MNPKRQRGQAMVEYAILLSFLFIFAFVIPIPSSVVKGKDETGASLGDKTLMQALIEAYRVYTVSHYYVLNLPFP